MRQLNRQLQGGRRLDRRLQGGRRLDRQLQGGRRLDGQLDLLDRQLRCEEWRIDLLPVA